ncbi:hypothetical protein K439DRAFT_122659 [Ramaria rubella]|nr:hypothetical protein K439DRAFT_122659 [Ramaria rubella]
MKKQREQQATPTPDVDQLVNARVAEITARQSLEHESAVQAAVASATEKLRAELQASAGIVGDASQGDMADVMSRHQEEMKALETRLTEKHAAEVKAAVSSALASVPKPETNGEAAHDVEALVKERLEAVQKEHEQKLADAVKSATENGRKEISTKFMLKDKQLVKAVTAKKELEEKVKELESKIANLQPTTASASTNAASSIPATPIPNKNPVNASLPRKPSISAVASSSSPATQTQVARGAPRGRGRGVAIRGGAAAAAAHAAGRGGVLAQVNSAAAASPSGTSILGAANSAAALGASKRPRDDTEPEAESPSLAKRLRGAPVTIQRNRHIPPPDT